MLRHQETIGQRCAGEVVCRPEDGLLVVELLRHRIPRHVAFADFYATTPPDGALLVGLGVGRRVHCGSTSPTFPTCWSAA